MGRYSERSLLLLLAGVQFTHIMDFMIMMPLGPQLMRELHLGPGQFSALVATYTISSGIVGLLAAPFIDRFDRRTLLLWLYAGFTVATLGCALAHDTPTLLAARALSGAFGGVSAALVMAIISDVVPAERRATSIGIVMTAFSAAAALGVPFGLYLAQRFKWEAPFFMLAGIAAVMWLLAFKVLPPVRGHLAENGGGRLTAFVELLRDANAGRALLFMAAMVFGHFTIIPLLSPHLVLNVGLPENYLPVVYFIGGGLTVFTAPRVGRLADSLGHFRVYGALVAVASVVILAITHAGRLPIWTVLALSGLFFIFGSGRFVPGQAIMSLAVPASRRGAFMSLTNCARDLASGFSSSVGGWIVVKGPAGQLLNMHWLGWLAVTVGLISLWLGHGVRVNEAGVAPRAPGREEHESVAAEEARQE
ncbi:MAG: MFS transporter [Verrucomicrobiota bacterium]